MISYSDLDKLKEGISEKLGIFVYLLMTFVISVIFSFFYGWKLTLVILSCAPVIVLATAFVAKVRATLNSFDSKFTKFFISLDAKLSN